MSRTLLAAAVFVGLIPLPGSAEPGASTRPAAGFWTYDDFVAGRIPQTYSVRRGHPRLLITPENREEIVARAKAAPKLWQRVIATAERGESEEMVLACAAIHQLGRIPGFEYALNREGYGRKGVTGLMALIEHKPPRAFFGPGYQLGLPCGYDWLHPLLSEAQKRAIVEELIRLSGLETKPLNGINGPVGGPRMTNGLAFCGDGVDDAAAREIVERTFRKVWWNPDRKGLFSTVLQMVLYLEGGGWEEGMSYFPCNYRIFPHVAIWKTATGQDYFARMGYFRNVPYWMAHAVVPQASPGIGRTISLFRYSAERVGSHPWLLLEGMVFAATGYLKDCDPAGAALARWWFDRHGAALEKLRYGLVFGLLLGDPRVEGRSPAELKLPRTLVMPGMGLVYMRSSWSDADAAVLAFANNRFARYRAEGHNCFSLWKNGGALFPFRGRVAGHRYFQPQAVPFNNVAFYRGTEVVTVSPRVAAPPTRSAVGSALDIGPLEVHSVPGHLDYVVGDCGRGFPKGQVKRCERTLIYLRPERPGGADHIVLRDRTQTTSPELVPHAIFQSILEPKVGPDWQRDQAGRAVVPGQWRIDGCPCITVTNDHLGRKRPFHPEPRKAHARAFVRVLLPETAGVLKVGGEDHPLDGLDGKPGTKYLDAFNRLALSDKLDDGGLWRFHVVPQAAAAKHVFLHAIEATDSSADRPGPLDRLQATGAIAVQAGGNVVVLSPGESPLVQAKVTVSAETSRVVVGDAVPRWRYALTAGRESRTATASRAGCALFTGLRLAPGETLQLVASRPAP